MKFTAHTCISSGVFTRAKTTSAVRITGTPVGDIIFNVRAAKIIAVRRNRDTDRGQGGRWVGVSVATPTEKGKARKKTRGSPRDRFSGNSSNLSFARE